MAFKKRNESMKRRLYVGTGIQAPGRGVCYGV